MNKETEKAAMEYLLNEFSHHRYSFSQPTSEDKCEIVIHDRKDERRFRGELKSSNTKFMRDSNIRERLVFNKKDQRDDFKSGELWIVRVFMKNDPVKVILITNRFLGDSADVVPEDRYVIRGQTKYEECDHLS